MEQRLDLVLAYHASIKLELKAFVTQATVTVIPRDWSSSAQPISIRKANAPRESLKNCICHV